MRDDARSYSLAQPLGWRIDRQVIRLLFYWANVLG